MLFRSYVTCPDVITVMPAGAEAFATDESGRLTFGFRMQKGKGKLYYLAGQWLTKDEIQVSAMEKVLEDRERDIIIRRYGLNGEKEETQQEVGKRYGISRSYVSRIEKRALQKLRAVLEK